MQPLDTTTCGFRRYWGAALGVLLGASILAGVAALAGCRGDYATTGGPAATQPGGAVVKYGPAPKESYNPKIGRYGGRYVASQIGEGLKTFNPITASETSTTDYTKRIFEPLVKLDPWTYEPRPWLAESWEHSPDFLVWTLRLRPNVKFNNGMPLTADDVVFTFETMYNPDIACPTRDLIMVDGKPWKVEKVDSQTVRFTLPSTYAVFLETLYNIDVGAICKAVCEPVVKAGKFNAFLGPESTPDQVVGTGPFMLEKYIPGQRLILKKNPHYWRRDAKGNQLPYLDSMMVIWVQNIDTMLLKFQAGETDQYPMRGTDYPILKPRERQGNFKVYELGPLFGSEFVMFNQNEGKNAAGKPYVEPYKLKWFRDTRFRQAVSHCLDREGIIKTVYNGLAEPQWGPESPATGYFYNPNVKKYPYDLEKAKALLAEAGLKDRNGDGILEDEQGNAVQFTLMTNSGNNLREQIAEILRKDMSRLGMKVDLKYIEFNTLISKMDETYDWEAIVMGLTGGPEPNDGANIWKSNARTHEWYPRQEKPSTPWEAEIDEIFNKGIKEMDRAKRKALYDRWQEIAAEQQPLVYTVAQAGLVAMRDRFENVYPTPLAGAWRQATTWNLDEIFIKERLPLQ